MKTATINRHIAFLGSMLILLSIAHSACCIAPSLSRIERVLASQQVILNKHTDQLDEMLSVSLPADFVSMIKEKMNDTK